MEGSKYIREITEIVHRLGAPLDQAEVMARQVLKRAPQIAQSRDISEVAAVQYLLRLIHSGVQGEVPPEMASTEGLRPDNAKISRNLGIDAKCE